jgi:hypothetical protein
MMAQHRLAILGFEMRGLFPVWSKEARAGGACAFSFRPGACALESPTHSAHPMRSGAQMPGSGTCAEAAPIVTAK